MKGGLAGKSAAEDLAKQAELWGIELDDRAFDSIGDTGVWPKNVPAVEAFLAVQSQWQVVARADGSNYHAGIDYAGAAAGLTMAGIEMDPDLWAQVRLIERGAADAANAK